MEGPFPNKKKLWQIIGKNGFLDEKYLFCRPFPSHPRSIPFLSSYFAYTFSGDGRALDANNVNYIFTLSTFSFLGTYIFIIFNYNPLIRIHFRYKIFPKRFWHIQTSRYKFSSGMEALELLISFCMDVKQNLMSFYTQTQ